MNSSKFLLEKMRGAIRSVEDILDGEPVQTRDHLKKLSHAARSVEEDILRNPHLSANVQADDVGTCCFVIIQLTVGLAADLGKAADPRVNAICWEIVRLACRLQYAVYDELYGVEEM